MKTLKNLFTSWNRGATDEADEHPRLGCAFRPEVRPHVRDQLLENQPSVLVLFEGN